MPRTFVGYLRNPRLWQLALACYWAALFTTTHIPMHRLTTNLGSADKVAHLGAFAALAVILATTWRVSAGRFGGRQLFMALTLIMLYATLEELTQPIVGRVASVWDWLADALGATLGLLLVYFLPATWFGEMPPAQQEASRTRRSLPRAAWLTIYGVLILAIVVCFWLVLPTIHAHNFVRAIQQRKYADADSLFVDQSASFPGDRATYEHFESEASLVPPTWEDVWKGVRRTTVETRIVDHEGLTTHFAKIRATRSGLSVEDETIISPQRATTD